MNKFKEFSILSWNIRGATSDVAKRHLREYIKKQKPLVVILTETHVQSSQVKCFLDKLGFFMIHVVEARGHAGGIWWLSADKSVDIMVTDTCEQAITRKISKGGSFCWCSAVYASLIPSVHNHF